MPTQPYVALPLDQTGVRYAHGPDSTLRPGVPAGTVTTYECGGGAAFPGVPHRFAVHVPAAYDGSQPAALVVCLDGDGFLDPDEDLRTGVVLDNLVHRGDLPVTIGVFVDPGEAERADGRRQRNVEYDAPDDRLVSFLLDEVLAEVARHWRVTDDPSRRAVCGFSSGGNAAFTAAWHRPDVFGRVVALLPSFAQMPGGNPYPALLPREDRKPLRVFLQAGHRDLGWDEPEGNWLAQTLRTAAALAEAGYDVRLVLGDGGHDPNHGGVLLPDALRWVFAPATVR